MASNREYRENYEAHMVFHNWFHKMTYCLFWHGNQSAVLRQAVNMPSFNVPKCLLCHIVVNKFMAGTEGVCDSIVPL